MTIAEKIVRAKNDLDQAYEAGRNSVTSGVGTVVDDSTALIKTVPKNSISHCYINSIGGMTYKCNQLIPFPYKETSKTMNGVTFTVATDGTITANGTATELAYMQLANKLPLPKGKYFLSGAPSNTNFILSLYKGSNWVTEFADRGSGIAIDTSTYDYDSVVISCFVYAGKTVNNAVFKPMLNEGSTALPLEPFFDGLRDAKCTALKIRGANWLDLSSFIGTSVTQNGGTLTCNADGGVTGSGTPTNYVALEILHYYIPKNRKYTIFAEGNFENMACEVYVYNFNEERVGIISVTPYQKAASFDLTQYSDYSYLRIYPKRYQNNQEMSGTAYFYIVEGEYTADTMPTYKPYHELTYPIPDELLELFNGKGVNGYYDEIDCVNNIVFKKFNTIVFDGNENWRAVDTNTSGVCRNTLALSDDIALFYGADVKSPIVCSHYTAATLNQTYIKKAGIGVTSRGGFSIYDEKYNTADISHWKAYLADQYANGTPVTATYAVAEPTEIDLPVGFSPLIPVEEGGTIEFVNEYGYAVPSKITYQTVVGG